MITVLLAQVPPEVVIGLMMGIALFSLVACVLCAKYFNIWIQAKMTQTNVGILDLVGHVVA